MEFVGPLSVDSNMSSLDTQVRCPWREILPGLGRRPRFLPSRKDAITSGGGRGERAHGSTEETRSGSVHGRWVPGNSVYNGSETGV